MLPAIQIRKIAIAAITTSNRAPEPAASPLKTRSPMRTELPEIPPSAFRPSGVSPPLDLTSLASGTIVPIGSTTDWPVYVDETIVGRRVAMGAGSHGYSLFVEADDLIRAYDATVADISVPE